MAERKKAQISEASWFFMQNQSKENGKYCNDRSAMTLLASETEPRLSHLPSVTLDTSDLLGKQ